MLTVGSAFSGIGGFDLAAERNGMQVLWQSEINPDARAVLANRFPNVDLRGDIKEVSFNGPNPVPYVDVLCGGSPCQDLSVSGKRAGLAGARSGLFFEFARLVEEGQPQWVVFENVPGLLSSDGGRDMGSVIGTLADLGYMGGFRVLDAQHFGVPQRRRRVVLVCTLGDGSLAREVLFDSPGSGWDPEPRRKARKVLAAVAPAGVDDRGELGPVAALTACGVGTCGADDNQAQAGHLLALNVNPVSALTTRCGNVQDDQQLGQLVIEPTAFSIYPLTGQGSDLGGREISGPTPALTATAQAQQTDRGTFIAGEMQVAAFSENQRAEVRETPYVRSITVGGGKPGQGYPAVRDGLAVRRLTPKECERLQGFPDDWTLVPNDKGKPMSDAARYRMAGNAVAVPVFEWVFGRIAQVHTSVNVSMKEAA